MSMAFEIVSSDIQFNVLFRLYPRPIQGQSIKLGNKLEAPAYSPAYSSQIHSLLTVLPSDEPFSSTSVSFGVDQPKALQVI